MTRGRGDHLILDIPPPARKTDREATPTMEPQFRRLAEAHRPRIALRCDGVAIDALEGDTVLTALLLAGRRVRDSEFGDGPRAGFCLMGACQDCWIWLEDGRRIRACTTYVEPGMRIRTTWPDRLLAS